MVLGNEAATDLKGKEAITSELETTESGKNITTTIIEHHVETANKSSTNTITGTIDDQAKNKSTSTSTDDGEMKLSVLIVDDSSLTRLMHSSMARTLGLEAEVAVDGQKAVDLHRSGASFDLILMDREMPVMDGVEATKELRAMGVDTMIVGVTTSDATQIQIFLEAGLNECYTKPLAKDKLATIIPLIKEAKYQKAEN